MTWTIRREIQICGNRPVIGFDAGEARGCKFDSTTTLIPLRLAIPPSRAARQKQLEASLPSFYVQFPAGTHRMPPATETCSQKQEQNTRHTLAAELHPRRRCARTFRPGPTMRLRYDGCAPAHASSTRFSRLLAREVRCHKHDECSCSCSVFRPRSARFCLNLSPSCPRASARPPLLVHSLLPELAGLRAPQGGPSTFGPPLYLPSPAALPSVLALETCLLRNAPSASRSILPLLTDLHSDHLPSLPTRDTYGPSPRPLMTPPRSHPHLH